MAFIQTLLLLFIAGFLVMQNKDKFGNLFGASKRKVILDSCALIDGRVVELVRSGFIADQLVIPQFVLNELQLLADGNDGHKRERARFGLDIAHELQDTAFEAKVLIDRTPFPEVPATDDKLIHLAKKLEAYLYTTDYNLAKVAAIEAVGVLNVNELSQAIRPIALPGETLKIKIVQKGSNPNQGVGYLEDGTMIVVEGGARYTGKIVDVTVTRMHQTVAGKMVFGQVREQPQPQPQRQAAQQHGQRVSAQEAQKQKLQERLRAPQPQPAVAVKTTSVKSLLRQQPEPQAQRPRQRRSPSRMQG